MAKTISFSHTHIKYMELLLLGNGGNDYLFVVINNCCNL